MILLGANELTKAYVTKDVLKGVTFNIKEGDKIGLVGNNGCGKTTLLKIIIGELSKDDGEIYQKKDLRIGYLQQMTSLDLDCSIYDECLKVFKDTINLEKEIRSLELKMSSISDSREMEKTLERYQNLQDEFNAQDGYEYNSRIKGMLKGFGFEENEFSKSVNHLSGGQKSRIQIAKLLLSKPDLLLLDEPTNHLDLKAIDFLQNFLKDFPGAILVVSHDRYFLDKICNRIFLMEDGKILDYNGNYSEFSIKRKRDFEIQMATYENQQKEIKRQEEIIERFANYGSKRYIKQSQSRRKLLDKMKVVERPKDFSGSFSLKLTPSITSGRDVLKVEELSKAFKDKKLFRDVSFDVFKGEKVGIIGPNGVGKTTLFKMIMGYESIDSGSILLGSQVKMGYFDQEQKNLNDENTILDEIWNEYPKLSHYEIRSYLAKFLFIGDDIFDLIENLSGGERSRLELLKLMLSSSNFLLMDEPTNHLDIDSKEILEGAMLDYEGTALIISHDRYFLNKVVDKIIVLKKDGTTTYLGNYDYYIEKLEEENTPIDEDGLTKTQIIKDRKKLREIENEFRKAKKKLKELEEKISLIEREIAELNSMLLKEEIYNDYIKSQEIMDSIKKKEEIKDELFLEWSELVEILD
ncbi:ABC-F family ATP-binding cassette domain-containing protein [Lagierella sp.]|uniref:ABC-F family ATP-binding cassette domain-containing protein n=1 Tax=Lagierella sp. TaxID=2849657 RepID=UPI00261D5A69|nr:ABC-F family ATP-binding cassette domain-containing protein [Lagierella sp.]